LAQFSDFFQGGDDKFDSGLGVDEGRLSVFVVQCFCLFGVENAIAEADDFAGLGGSYREGINAPGDRVILMSVCCDTILTITLGKHGRAS